MIQLLAFHGSQKLKDERIALVKDKIAKGLLLHGTYGEERDGVMMGCAVFISTCDSKHPHQHYPDDLGIPLELAYLKDKIFEGLKAPHDKQWPVKFFEAIQPGADLSRVNAKFQYWLMLENLKHEKLWREQDKKDEYTSKLVAAIKEVAEILKKWAETGIIEESAARSAAESAAESARSAAESARSAAESARSAAESAWSAAESAWSAARSARSAAESARSAESDFYIKCSEKLLELLSQAPVMEVKKT